jgi:hypothetical protein
MAAKKYRGSMMKMKQKNKEDLERRQHSERGGHEHERGLKGV